jgi:hypothetical protein
VRWMLLIGWGELTLVELALVSSPTVVSIDMGGASCIGHSTLSAYRPNYTELLYKMIESSGMIVKVLRPRDSPHNLQNVYSLDVLIWPREMHAGSGLDSTPPKKKVRSPPTAKIDDSTQT